MARRHFLSWTQPVLPAVAAWLLRDWRDGVLDLSDLVAIVPTAEAGRQVREALALAASAQGTAVLSPHVITPEVITSWAMQEMPLPASAAEELLLWMHELQTLPMEEFSALFPVPPASRDMAWARGTAGELLRLRRRLEEGGRTVAMAARRLGMGHPEAARWQALAALEERVLAAQKRAGLSDSVSSRLAAAASPLFPPGVQRIALLCVPDPVHLVLMTLEAAEKSGTAVDVIIHAPESLADSFDEWGRPRTDIWGARVIDLPDPEQRIKRCTRPEDEAAALLAAHQNGAAIGSADPDVTAPLQSRAMAESARIFDPNGIPLGRHAFSFVLESLAELLRHDSADAAGRLLHIPAVLESAGLRLQAMTILREWDAFRAAHLPRTLEDACALFPVFRKKSLRREVAPASALEPVLPWLRDLTASLRGRHGAAVLHDYLETLAGCCTFAADPLSSQALEQWLNELDTLSAATARTGVTLETPALLECALHLLRDARIYPDNSAGDAVLSGWLELAWQSAPDVAVAGLNEGMAPDSITGDPWIPDSARATLDLKTNAVRLARDSYLLSSLIESRRDGGSVTLHFAKESPDGDPLKPSRLLLRCPESELPARALFLFPGDGEASGNSPPSWTRAWRLRIPAPDKDARVFKVLSVTQFSDYLRCPFRFYLKHVLKMEPFDADRDELDHREFGSLIHDTIELLHRDELLRDSCDEEIIAGFLDQKVQHLATEKFGAEPALPVIIQLESARSRLRTMAQIHAAQRSGGWRMESCEINFPELPGNLGVVSLEGVQVRGRIDLIERHAETGERRVLDYKTGKPSSPAEAHLRKLSGAASGELPPWQLTTWDGKLHAWTNLQLPFYLWIIRKLPGADCGAGYFNLPAAATEAGVHIWENFDAALVESAVECAGGIIRSINAGIFWPPSKSVSFDDYKPLIHGTVEESFDAELLEKFRALAT